MLAGEKGGGGFPVKISQFFSDGDVFPVDSLDTELLQESPPP